MFEFDLLNNKSEKKDEFFIMKYLFIEHKYPINKNFLIMNKNQGCQEKIQLKYNKNKVA